MKYFNFKKLLAVVFAASCCANAFAYWGHKDPIIDEVIPKYWDYSTSSWMDKIADDTPLGKITMISSHDAGMDEDHASPVIASVVSAQYHSLKEQMEFGARFFDIRVWKCNNGKYYAYHGGSSGLSLDNMFSDAVQFIKEHDSEVVILKFSHWYYPENALEVIGKIMQNSEWSQYLYKSDAATPPILNEVPLKDLRGKIVLLVDTPGSSKDKPENANNHEFANHGYKPSTGVWHFGELSDNSPGKYGYYRIYDSYANTHFYSTMYDDQVNKWNNFLKNHNINTDSFMLCWQLTYGIIFNGAWEINPLLDEKLSQLCVKFNNHPNLVNIDFIDSRVCNAAINLNHIYVEGAKSGITYLDGTFSGDRVRYTKEVCKNFTILTGTKQEKYELGSGWYVVKDACKCEKGIIVKGAAKIILMNGSKLECYGDGSPAIRVHSEDNASLYIYAQSLESSSMGELVAMGVGMCAGIGSSNSHATGEIRIYGGKITAEGGGASDGSGAGIGGGRDADGRNIYIYGGIVTARADTNTGAAGIGGGYGGSADGIYIYGGTVTATGKGHGAGIGGGCWNKGGGNCSNVYIYGGDITAKTEDKYGAGIGGGEYGNCQTLNIYGGKIYAEAGYEGAGIGGGYGGYAKNITIDGGYIKIKGNKYGAGIGGGYKHSDSWPGYLEGLTINGGTIYIEGVSDAADIGGGHNDSGRNININGGSIWSKQTSRRIDNPKHNDNPLHEVRVSCPDEGEIVHVYGLKDYGVKDLYKIEGGLRFWLPDGYYEFSTDRYRFKCTVNGGNVDASLVTSSIEVEVGSTGYATVYSTSDLEVPEDVRVFAYTYSSEKNMLIPTEIPAKAIIPGGQGYVIRAKSGKHVFFRATKPAGPYHSDLIGFTEPVLKGSAKVFGLGNIDGVTAFYEYNYAYLKPGKAYYIMTTKED